MLTREQFASALPTIAPQSSGLETVKEHVPSIADIVTLASFGLGAWWAIGGPTWAGILSIVGDEVDGSIARATKTTSERGSALDWGSDIALTALTIGKLGNLTGHPGVAVAASIPVLYAQASLRAKGWRPPVLSARALLMIAAMVIEREQ